MRAFGSVWRSRLPRGTRTWRGPRTEQSDLQFARGLSVARTDVETASGVQWETASARATAMERLVACGAGPPKPPRLTSSWACQRR
jgi:hypothetical protein